MPPHSISMPVMTSGRRADGAVFDHTDPDAHEIAATTTMSVPDTLARPLPVPTTSAATPAKPSTSPSTCGRRSRSRPKAAAINAAQIGIVARMTAAVPEGIRFSAIETSPLPPNGSARPITAAANHCLCGRADPAGRRVPAGGP